MSQPSQRRPLPWLPALALALVAWLQACHCGSTGVDNRRFACTRDDECATGFTCRQGECKFGDGPVEEPDGGVDAGTPDGGQPDGGGTDGGTPDGGTPDGGTSPKPTQLSFVTAPQTVVAGQCSGVVTVEAQNAAGNATPPGSSTTIALAASPNTGFEFFSNASCGSKIFTVTMASNKSQASFYFRSTVAQTVQLTAAAGSMLPASQSGTIVPAAPTRLAFVPPSQTVPAGGCSAAETIESRDTYGNPSPVSTQTQVTLSAPGSAGLSFFSDPGCTTAATQVVIPSGESRASFFFKGKTGGTFPLGAAAPGFSPGSQSATILPVVRTGTCTIPARTRSETCAISPPQRDLSKTLLLFQASSDDDNPDTASVRCSLTAVDTLFCVRNDGDDASDPAIQILWQTAELVSGLKVQSRLASCGGAALTSLPIQPVASPQNTFLLVSSEQDGSTQDDDDFYTASLAQSDRVDLQFSIRCHSTWRASVQVVELEGANVTRGLTESMTGTQLTISDLPAVDPASTALLFTYRTPASSARVMCDRVLRGELTSPTSITFSRGAGAAGCSGPPIESISWERIDFGARAQAQHFQVTMDASTQVATLPITAVDPTRTLVFASGQMQSGQAGGETSYASDDTIGASLGWHVLTTSPTSLRVSRGATKGSAQWFSTVLQLEP